MSHLQNLLKAHQRESARSRSAARRGWWACQNGARRQGFTSSRCRTPLPGCAPFRPGWEPRRAAPAGTQARSLAELQIPPQSVKQEPTRWRNSLTARPKPDIKNGLSLGRSLYKDGRAGILIVARSLHQ
jgi:hypothetical protein